MALLLSGSGSIGIILLSLLNGSHGDIQRFLFGDVLVAGPGDVARVAVLFLMIGGLMLWKLSPLTLFTTNEELAHVSGVPVKKYQFLFVILLAVTVAASIRLLGIILVTSLIV